MEQLLVGMPDLHLVEPLPQSLHEFRKKEPTEVSYECSNDMQYLRQYFFIREYAYRMDLQLQEFSGAEDTIDQYSYFIIARKGHFVVAGARLTISTPHSPRKLPLESEDFFVKHVMPELKYVPYAELGRTAVLPDYRSGDYLNEIFRVASETAIKFGCRYMLGASPAAVARRFRQAFHQLGYPTQIHSDIKPPVKPIHEHLRLQFITVNLQPSATL